MSQTTNMFDSQMSGTNGTSSNNDINVIGKLIPALIEVRLVQFASLLFDPMVFLRCRRPLP